MQTTKLVPGCWQKSFLNETFYTSKRLCVPKHPLIHIRTDVDGTVQLRYTVYMINVIWVVPMNQTVPSEISVNIGDPSVAVK